MSDMDPMTRARDTETPAGTFGTWAEADGSETYQTCEPGDPAELIDPGTYDLLLEYSPKHGYAVYVYQDTPRHTMVEVHPGNDEDDTTACTLLGDARVTVDFRGLPGVVDSQATVARFMARRGVANFKALTSPAAVAQLLAAHPACARFSLTVVGV